MNASQAAKERINETLPPIVVARLMGYSEKVFLTKANGNKRTRLFSQEDYHRFCRAFGAAREAASEGKPYYEEDDEGAVSKSYGYWADTAQWAVWVEPETLEVIVHIGRAKCVDNVSCARHGGMPKYQADWKKVKGE